jgi:hypothetical protein
MATLPVKTNTIMKEFIIGYFSIMFAICAAVALTIATGAFVIWMFNIFENLIHKLK